MGFMSNTRKNKQNASKKPQTKTKFQTNQQYLGKEIFSASKNYCSLSNIEEDEHAQFRSWNPYFDDNYVITNKTTKIFSRTDIDEFLETIRQLNFVYRLVSDGVEVNNLPKKLKPNFIVRVNKNASRKEIKSTNENNENFNLLITTSKNPTLSNPLQIPKNKFNECYFEMFLPLYDYFDNNEKILLKLSCSRINNLFKEKSNIPTIPQFKHKILFPKNNKYSTFNYECEKVNATKTKKCCIDVSEQKIRIKVIESYYEMYSEGTGYSTFDINEMIEKRKL